MRFFPFFGKNRKSRRGSEFPRRDLADDLLRVKGPGFLKAAPHGAGNTARGLGTAQQNSVQSRGLKSGQQIRLVPSLKIMKEIYGLQPTMASAYILLKTSNGPEGC